jgi:hypothetical protein
MFVRQKRFIDLLIDLIYWFGMIFYPRIIQECVTNTIIENAMSASWCGVKLSRQLQIERI